MAHRYPRTVLTCLALVAVMLLAACGKERVPSSPLPKSGGSYHSHKAGPSPKATFRPYTVNGVRYYPLKSADGFTQKGRASWYGKPFHGRKTSNGEVYNMYNMTCAHKILPMNTVVRVTNRSNGKSAVLRVNDRGPFVGTRVIDLSYAAAKSLGVIGPGTAPVKVEAIGMAGHPPSRSIAREVAGAPYYIQVGAFTEWGNAEHAREALVRQGFRQSRVRRAEVDGRSFYRVQAGRFDGMDRARRAHALLKSRYPQSFVLRD
ncbi:septal ring lytic transglycosylase RlpA family protein [Desulfobaculum bizertense]|uniref:Probable endolytic peptidoglycan transglycosylase RlpA n=1 Tax=Desulfobaculum bizertense DSM 18034 TaxID=1121442 RepID=A0A1T4WBS4_9BACT|nr:septal ring lytic transglycosylase RlpA family protein [Desulfobaculum bizertense]SKA74752.1 rare lipoprotein A [Desulfobaculum bizertense DSM 18034]